MDLSTVAHDYNVPLTRPERDLISRLDANASSGSEDRYERQMKDLATARGLAKQLPDRQTSERQNKLEKAAILKERLRTLRQMIPFLSPSAAKSLKAEMQQIAAQIASLTGGSGGGSGGGSVTAETSTPESAQTGNAAAPPQEATTQTDVAAKETDGGPQEQQPASSDGDDQRSAPTSTTHSVEDRQLKEAVEELRGLYKAVMAALKRKQQAGHGAGLELRVYVAMPETTGSVGVKV
ncbi:hypothetical protein [Geobacter sp. AOG2]|uniref:hypothetical protein n=1 Tax=Geobacter sp. AOG2 TaxID=1566347 RepID=UPI001CC5C241|nr:hypothetical protein [Geobacter sp. AOG2]GFE61035.1 hypothetical protein AOG2_16220 [Geobacter sp. AOG2]